MSSGAFPGVLTHLSPHAFTETVSRLERALSEQGMTVFARIDQQAEAEQVGLGLRPTLLVVFGNPRGGTPMMQAVPEAALDLLLKALAWQDDAGRVWLSALDPAALGQRWGLHRAALGSPRQRALLEGVVRP